jgi:glycerol uptake facilitator-like aquaporin
MAACWFTASTSFANPAVTIARSLSDTFSGIRPADVLPFVLAQFAGGVAATFLFRWFARRIENGQIGQQVGGGEADSGLALTQR